MTFLARLVSRKRDEAYLKSYIRKKNRPEVLRSLARVDPNAIADRYISSGCISEEDRSDFVREIRRGATVKRICFELPQWIKERTLPLTGADSTVLSGVPVGAMASTEFNGYVIFERGYGPVVVISAGLTTTLATATQLFSYLVLYDALPNVKGKHPKENLIRSLGSLAAEYSNPGKGHYQSMPSLAFLASQRPDMSVEAYTKMIEEFILLHEYGHIISKHRRSAAAVDRHKHTGTLNLLRSHKEEFAADAYAAEKLFASTASVRERIELLFALGNFFRFEDFCQAYKARLQGRTKTTVSDHPPAFDRWRKIVREHITDQDAIRLSTSLDSKWDALLIAYALPPVLTRSLYRKSRS